jgi:hypothetical protein
MAEEMDRARADLLERLDRSRQRHFSFAPSTGTERRSVASLSSSFYSSLPTLQSCSLLTMVYLLERSARRKVHGRSRRMSRRRRS